MKVKSFIATVMTLILLVSSVPISAVAANNVNTADSGKYDINEQKAESDLFWKSIEATENALIAQDIDKTSYMAAMYNEIAKASNVTEQAWDDDDTFSFVLSCGMPCIYDYDTVMTEKGLDGQGNNATAYYDYSTELKEASSNAKDIFLVGPYYGYDSSFTNFYTNLAKKLAAKTGGSATILSGTEATPAAIRQRCAAAQDLIMLFDSHGLMQNGVSYFCVRSSEGITTTDTSNKWAASLSSGVYGIDGRFMTNGGTVELSKGMYWFAICQGMSTSSICNPLLTSGAACIYGYSESVSFSGDYAYAGCFWDKMMSGATVAEAAAYMKAQCGEYDNTSLRARPIFVSNVDPYPSNINTSQKVNCTWTLDGDYTYIINYNANGGQNCPPRAVYTADTETGTASAVISSTVPWKFPYTFTGWADTATGEAIYFPGDSIDLTESKNLYAVWFVSDYLKENSANALSVSYADTHEYRQFVPSLSSEYTISVQNADNVSIFLYSQYGTLLASGTEIRYELAADTKYYICFSSDKPQQFELVISNGSSCITYDTNGGEFLSNSDINTGSYTVTDAIPIRFPYNFMGWAVTPDALTAEYHAGDEIASEQAITLYAVWSEPDTLTVNQTNDIHMESDASSEYRRIMPTVTGIYIISDASMGVLKLYNENGSLLVQGREIRIELTADSIYYLEITRNDTNYTSVTLKTDEPISTVLLGDANLDGTVNTADAVTILKFLAGISDLNDEQMQNSEVTYDGKVNTADAVKILKYSAGIIQAL